MTYHFQMLAQDLGLIAGAMTAVTVALTVVLGSSPLPQAKEPPEWDRIAAAWHAGDYPAALTGLQALLRSPAAADYRERAALLTGELFATQTIATDGSQARLAGNWLSYEAGGATRLVRVSSGETAGPIALAGTAASFDGPGTAVVYVASAGNGPRGSGALVRRDLESGGEQVLAPAGLLKSSPAFTADGTEVIFIGRTSETIEAPAGVQIYRTRAGGDPVALTHDAAEKTSLVVAGSGDVIVYGVKGGPSGEASGFVVLDLKTGTTRAVPGSAVTVSRDGRLMAWIARDDDTYHLNLSPPLGASVVTIQSGRERIDAPALSPDGSLVAWQRMDEGVWKVVVSATSGGEPRVVGASGEHTVLPRFLTGTRLVAMTGESRHRRAHLYDLDGGPAVRLFANNTLRTVSPEYAWTADTDGRRLVIEADRDGDTISPERGLYLVDLERQISMADLVGRVERQLADETALRDRAVRAFTPVASAVTDVVARIDTERVAEYERHLVALGSRHVAEPGNAAAIAYLDRMFQSFGYRTELQWFAPEVARGGRTANVVAIKTGTGRSDRVYVISSHFDSVPGSPGADDNGSGVAALLEAARVLADAPLPATVVFAALTGEESGLLGSRVFVERARAVGWQVAAVLNNDTIGWSGDSGRSDNTIRYSNPALRDVQHGAALLFTELVTYDARYYRNTDAQVFYDAWGDIVGGLGSYPILGNPHYHQDTDRLETVDLRQIAASAAATAAAVFYLASTPAPPAGLDVRRVRGGTEVRWTTDPDAASYLVAVEEPGEPLRPVSTVHAGRAPLPPLPPGTTIAVRAIDRRGLAGWDWNRVVLQE